MSRSTPKTGKVAWDHTTADWTKGGANGRPFIVNGKVIQGRRAAAHAGAGGASSPANDIKTALTVARQHHRHPGDPNLTTPGTACRGKPVRRLGVDSGAYDPTRTWFLTGRPALSVGLPNRGTLPKRRV